MVKSNLFVAAIVGICLSMQTASSFSLNKFNPIRIQQPTSTKKVLQSSSQQQVVPVSNNDLSIEDTTSMVIDASNYSVNDNKKLLQQSLLAGCISFVTTTPLSAFAAADDLELAELPPVYVPILFAIGVLGGVGVLTASLGNVMDEGECSSLLASYLYNHDVYRL